MEFLDTFEDKAQTLREVHQKAQHMLIAAINEEREYLLLVKQDKSPLGPVAVGGGASVHTINYMRDVLEKIIYDNTRRNNTPMHNLLESLLNGELFKMPLEDLIAKLDLTPEQIKEADAAAQAQGGKSLAELITMERALKETLAKEAAATPKTSSEWKE